MGGRAVGWVEEEIQSWLAERIAASRKAAEGATRTEAAKIGGVTLQIVRDWVLKFNAHGPEGPLNRKAPGQPSRLRTNTGRRSRG